MIDIILNLISFASIILLGRAGTDLNLDESGDYCAADRAPVILHPHYLAARLAEG